MTAEREKEVFDFIWESIRCHENDKTDADKMSGGQNGSEAAVCLRPEQQYSVGKLIADLTFYLCGDNLKIRE
jgi:hypothetical protein